MADSKHSAELKLFKYMGRMRFGTCNVSQSEPITLIVGCKEFDATRIAEEDVQWLDQNLEVAYYSKDNVKTTDLNVRNSKYTKTFNLNLNTDKLMDTMGIENSYVKPYKLNLYKKGCFFSNHRDTDRTGLLGTLIFILPTAHTGGELCFEEFNLDAYQKEKDKDIQNKIRFVFFDTELEHSVSEVTEGYRITALYNVYKNRAACKEIDPKFTFTETPNEWQREVLKYAHDFCAGKTNVLFGYFKYRNDVFHNILADLSDKFDVAEVAVQKVLRYESYEPKIEDIKEVHEIDKEVVEDGNGETFDDMVQKSYKVEHVLFPSQCKLETETADYTIGGNSPCSFLDNQVEYFSAYLITPVPYSERERSHNGSSTTS